MRKEKIKMVEIAHECGHTFGAFSVLIHPQSESTSIHVFCPKCKKLVKLNLPLSYTLIRDNACITFDFGCIYKVVTVSAESKGD